MDFNLPVKKSPFRSIKLYASRLEKLHISTHLDFIYHMPSRYEDFSHIAPVANIQVGEIVTIHANVIDAKTSYLRNRKSIQRATFSDGTGSIFVTWFNQPYLVKQLPVGTSVWLSGRADIFNKKLTMQSPDYEIETSEPIHTGRLVPIYPETYGVSSKWLRRQIHSLLKEIENEKEFLPPYLLKENNLMEYPLSLQKIHFPLSLEESNKARQRLAFDELFFLQVSALHRKREWKSVQKSVSLTVSKHHEKLEKLYNSLPFTLTNAQKKAVEDICSDIAKRSPMNRLLEGDVGSGKTVVAGIAMYITFLNGYQSVLMAPTEILAMQHFQTIERLFTPFGVRIGLATGSKKIQLDDFDVLIGTHALLSEKIQFKKLAFVIIDEQQRFGVSQRALIRKKGISAHLLTMTATPIPRTIALTMYGDLDVSFLDELPKGRQEIKTWFVPKDKREAAYRWIEQQITKEKSQAFIICPFIETSESMQTVKAASVEFARLKKDIFPNLTLGLLHGNLKAKEKDEVLRNFNNKVFDILVATPVVEVGIDIPNATIMMIEAAERFGLSQLHQLRGRVGRGKKQSYCLLFSDAFSKTSYARLKAMEKLHIGAELAELDLRLRGPGSIYGTEQSGKTLLKIATFSDTFLLQKAKIAAEQIFPNMEEFPEIRGKMKQLQTQDISPD